MRNVCIAASIAVLISGGSVVYATQPSYGDFKLSFAKPPRIGEPNILVAKFVYWMSCQEGELDVSIPEIGEEPARKVNCWKGPVIVNDTISVAIEVPPLPRGAYQFWAECRPSGCGAFPDERGGAAISVWVMSEGIVTAPVGLTQSMLDTILNHLEIENLGKATGPEIRERSPQLYRIMYGDFSIPLDTSADPRKDPSLNIESPPTAKTNTFTPDSLDSTTTIKANPPRAKRPRPQHGEASSELDPPRIRLPHLPPADISGDSTTIIIDSGQSASPERIEEVRRLRELYLRDLPDTVIPTSPTDSVSSRIDQFEPNIFLRNP